MKNIHTTGKEKPSHKGAVKGGEKMPQHTVVKDDLPKNISAEDFARMIGTTQDDFAALLLQGVEKYRRGEIPKKDKEERTCGQVVY